MALLDIVKDIKTADKNLESQREKLRLASYNLAMKACVRDGDWQLCYKRIHEMRAEGIRPDLLSYNTLLRSCATAGEWKV